MTAPTRLDWTFVVSNQSVAEPPANWLGNYDSTGQTFDLYVPPRRNAKQALPAILFISANNDSQWKGFEATCKKLGFVFIGVRNAGNDVQGKKRVRIVLDAFDEARRLVPLDPDRTYVAGISGGARMACLVGFALPEHFGGILAIIAGGEPRQESWLRQRAVDRLSVALITGTGDFNRNEVEQLRTPFLKDVGIRAAAGRSRSSAMGCRALLTSRKPSPGSMRRPRNGASWRKPIPPAARQTTPAPAVRQLARALL